MPRITSIAHLLLLVFLCGSTISCCCLRWSQADKFVEGLRCGISEEELNRYAATFRGALVHKPEQPSQIDVIIIHGGTHVRCWLPNEKLEVIQVSWISGIMKVTTESKRYLCESEAPFEAP